MSFRDALIIAAARKSGATLLLSDTLQPYRAITGLELQNPFAVGLAGSRLGDGLRPWGSSGPPTSLCPSALSPQPFLSLPAAVLFVARAQSA